MSALPLKPRVQSALLFTLGLGLASASSAAAQATPGVVQGLILDTHGKPINRALVWIEPSITTGLVRTSTDASGRYRVENPSKFPHNAKAWTRVEFGGETFCLRLGMPKPQDFDAFSPASGVVRNFKWQLTGVIEDLRDYKGYFGGEVRIFKSFESDKGLESTDRAEFTLTPIGPLADGSAGVVIKKLEDKNMMLYDIPLGKYSVVATVVKASGQRLPAQVGVGYTHELKSSAVLEFKPSSGCGNGSGIDRAFLSYGL